MFWTLMIVVDGALEHEEDYDDADAMDTRIREERMAAQLDGLITQVYVVEHAHEPTDDGECACVQYLTDTHPAYTFPGDAYPPA